MTVADLTIWWHDDCLLHDAGAGLFEVGPHPWIGHPEPHPESAARLVNMRSVLQAAPIGARLAWATAPVATDTELRLFHTADHVARMREWCGRPGVTEVANSTFVSVGSWPAIVAAAGAAVGAADAAVRDRGMHYCLVRPPGHHAAPDRADGYCLMNNAGIVVRRLQHNGVGRVAVVDVDAHHGNGTQAGFATDPDVLTISLHMDHRGWGDGKQRENGTIDETGSGAGEGTNINVPLPYASGNAAYGETMRRVVVPAVLAFAPEVLVLVSGQDAGQFDPNGRMCLTVAGYHAIGASLRRLRADLGDIPLIGTQEGGYSTGYSAFCLLGLVAGLLDEDVPADPMGYLPDWPVDLTVLDDLQSHPALAGTHPRESP